MQKLCIGIFFFIVCFITGLYSQTADIPQSLASLESFKCIECKIKPLSAAHARSHHLRKQPGSEFGTRPHSQVFADGTSLNWSGYVAATSLQSPAPKSVKAVFGIWAVPTLSPTSTNTYASNWVGIDGYGSPTVEQIGTSNDWVNGVQENYAWFEMYPRPAYEIADFPVENNDIIGASVSFVGNGVFVLSMTNYTKQVTTTVPTTYTVSTTAQRSSAEWIVEAPSSIQGILPLANFGYVPMVNCAAKINNIVGPINHPNWQNIGLAMQNQNGVVRALLPAGLIAGGDSFFVDWNHE